MTDPRTYRMFADSLSANDNARTLAEVEAEADELKRIIALREGSPE